MGLRQLAIGLCATIAMSASAMAKGQKFDVYEYVIEAATTSHEATCEAVRAAATQAGWEVLAARPAGVPEECEYKATVFAVVNTAFTAEIMAMNPNTAPPFAAVDRVNVFEDENGAHVSIVDPRSTHSQNNFQVSYLHSF